MKNALQSKMHEYVKKFNEIKTVFDSLPDGIVAILDEQMHIAAANKAISKMLLLPVEKIIGKKADDLFAEKNPALNAVLKETLHSRKGVRNHHVEVVSSSGEVLTYLVSTVIIEEIRDTDFGVVLILNDISEMTRLRKIVSQMDRYGEIIGASDSMKQIFALIESIKNYDTSVLIMGETGTGKELIARVLHSSSVRKNNPFIPVNCSALPESLIESELFGHVKGAFTGADAKHIGRFQAADGGTLFLDEVGTLSLKTQVKLLRALQEKIIEPVGSSESIPVNIRIVSATNRDLSELVAKGEFREDLFYRLKVMKITLPPLRDRIEDIPVLAHHFISRLNRYYRKNILGISPSAEELLKRYAWPGNVRELENAVEHAFVLSNGALIEVNHLPPELRHATKNGIPPLPPEIDLDAEEVKIRKALLVADGSRDKAAELLNMHRTTLWRKIKEFKISKDYGKKGR